MPKWQSVERNRSDGENVKPSYEKAGNKKHPLVFDLHNQNLSSMTDMVLVRGEAEQAILGGGKPHF